MNEKIQLWSKSKDLFFPRHKTLLICYVFISLTTKMLWSQLDLFVLYFIGKIGIIKGTFKNTSLPHQWYYHHYLFERHFDLSKGNQTSPENCQNDGNDQDPDHVPLNHFRHFGGLSVFRHGSDARPNHNWNNNKKTLEISRTFLP